MSKPFAKRMHALKIKLTLAAAGGCTFFLEGCDPTLRQTTEDGIISLSQSLLASIFQAGINLFTEAQSA